VFRSELSKPPPGLPRLKAGVDLPSPFGGGMEPDADSAALKDYYPRLAVTAASV